jgi:protein kinase-like protein
MNRGSPPTALAHAAAPVIAEHELLHPIASGSYGEVWLARSTVGTLRAVKIVRRDRFERVEDFEREFRGLQRFEPVSRTHDALIDILQIGRQHDWFYYVMELADDANAERSVGVLESWSDARGQTAPDSSRVPHQSSTPALQHSNSYTPLTLRQVIRQRGSLPAAEVVELGSRLDSALEHLHAQGLVHRDVKPSNILFVNGQPKLADAGLVAAVDDAHSLVGTAGYIPPEGPGTPQADIYSLGKVLYEAAFGKDRQEFPQLPPDLATRQDHAQLLELNEVIVRACARDPTQRYPNAQSMRAEIESLGRGESVSLSRRLGRRYALLRKACVAIVLVVLLVPAAVALVGRLFGRGPHSLVPGVDALVAAGVQCGISQTPARLDQAQQFFAQAAQLDPKFAPALIGLFRTRLLQQSSSPTAPDGAEANVRAAATQLMAIAPELAEARLAASYTNYLDGNWREAITQARLATQMPIGSGKDGVAMVHGVYGWYLLHVGETAAALREFQIADRARLADPIIQVHLGQPYLVWRKFDQALAYYSNSVAIEPRQYWAYACIGEVYEEMEDFEKAIWAFQKADIEGGLKDSKEVYYEELRNALKQGGKEGYLRKRLETCTHLAPADLYGVAIYHAKLGETNLAYEYLGKACDDGRIDGLWLDLCWDHTDPRFQAVASKLRLKP